MQSRFSDIDDIFGLFGSAAELADSIDSPIERVRKWRQRKCIPQAHWPSLIEAAAARRKKLTANDLLAVHR